MGKPKIFRDLIAQLDRADAAKIDEMPVAFQ